MLNKNKFIQLFFLFVLKKIIKYDKIIISVLGEEVIFMIKVTLLGDSIRQIGYGTVVPRLLGNEFEVFQPKENCKFSKNTLRGLFDWHIDMQNSRIIHWNNGLWDVCDLFGDGPFTAEDEYVTNMSRIADILTAHYEKVIFATTTPVTEQNCYNKNSVIKRYNELIVPILLKKGIIINDLYGLVASDIDKYIRKDDNIHLTDAGIDACSAQVVEHIYAAAKDLSYCDEGESYVLENKDKHIGAPI